MLFGHIKHVAGKRKFKIVDNESILCQGKGTTCEKTHTKNSVHA